MLPSKAGLQRAEKCQSSARASGVRGMPEVDPRPEDLREASFVFEDQLGNHHNDARCNAVTGPMVEIRQCKICGT